MRAAIKVVLLAAAGALATLSGVVAQNVSASYCTFDASTTGPDTQCEVLTFIASHGSQAYDRYIFNTNTSVIYVRALYDIATDPFGNGTIVTVPGNMSAEFFAGVDQYTLMEVPNTWFSVLSNTSYSNLQIRVDLLYNGTYLQTAPLSWYTLVDSYDSTQEATGGKYAPFRMVVITLDEGKPIAHVPSDYTYLNTNTARCRYCNKLRLGADSMLLPRLWMSRCRRSCADQLPALPRLLSHRPGINM